MDWDAEIDDLRAALARKSLETELSAYQKGHAKGTEERITELTIALSSDSPSSKEASPDALEDLTEMVYKQPWSRLGDMHKETKLKEYIQALNLPPTPEKNKIAEALQALKEGKLKGTKYVTYDPLLAKLTKLELPLKKAKRGKKKVDKKLS